MPRPLFATAETTLPPLNAAIDDPTGPLGPATRKDLPAERVLRLWKHHAERGVVPDLGTASGAKVYAYVNAGRWMVDCPFPPCSSAQVPSWTDPRFFCIECENRAVAGQWVAVVWPSAAMVTKIEAALRVRPVANQFWRPGEKVKDLEAENVSHGLAAGMQAMAFAKAQAEGRILLPWDDDGEAVAE